MDNGEEIPRLNDNYTFMGAAVADWIGGLVAFMLVSEIFFKGAVATSMPILLAVMVGVTFGLAAMRAKFPDEQRGIANYFSTSCGFSPPGIPSPAPLQPYWSGAPVRKLKDKCEFVTLGLEELFPNRDPYKEE